MDKNNLLTYVMDRYCPPISQMFSESAKAHLEVCPSCQEIYNMKTEFEVAGEILSKIPTGNITKSIPRPGEIRRIYPRRMDLLWKGVKYMNPPQVLILTPVDEFGFLRVAQIHSYQEFFDPEDEIQIKENRYAECWNVYGLPIGAIAPRTYSIRYPTSLVDSVIARSEGKFRHVHGNLHSFRTLEVELGFFYSWTGNNIWLDKIEETDSCSLPA